MRYKWTCNGSMERNMRKPLMPLPCMHIVFKYIVSNIIYMYKLIYSFIYICVYLSIYLYAYLSIYLFVSFFPESV